MRFELFPGDVPNGWQITTLGRIVEQGGGHIQTGPFGSQLHASDYVIDGIPSIMPVNIGDNRIVEEGIARITEADAQRLNRHRVKPGDIIYSRRGDIERRALVREGQNGWLCGTGCLKVRIGGSEVIPEYASYYLSHPDVRAWIVRHAVGATMPNLNTGIMEAVPFLVPPPPTQSSIVSILGDIDDKIHLNQEINQDLKQMAQAMFKSWFVDFEPVKAKMAAKKKGRDPERAAMCAISGKTEAQLDQLSQAQQKQLAKTAALFPHSFQQSEIGDIPVGWSVDLAARHLDAIRGLSYKGSGLGDSGTPMHNLNSVYEGGGYKYEGIKYYTGAYNDKHLATPGDVIVANTEQGFDHLLIGYGAIVPKSFPHGIFSHHLFRVRPKPSSTLTSYYILHLFLPGGFRRSVAGFTNGTTVNMLPPAGLSMPKLVCPSAEIIAIFSHIVEPFYDEIDANVNQSRTLTELRETLLPKLLKGELAV